MHVFADPAEIERFARELRSFSAQFLERSSRLQGQFDRLGDTWRDAEQQKFAVEFEQTVRIFAQFFRAAETQIPFLQRKAALLRTYNSESLGRNTGAPSASILGAGTSSVGGTAQNFSATPEEDSNRPERGGAESAYVASLAPLEPNKVYEDNGYLFRTNQQGQVARVEGRLVLGMGVRDQPLQQVVGKSGSVGDEGGHIIAARFQGPSGLYNLFPQNMNLNRGQWKALENRWEEYQHQGYQIDVRIRLEREDEADVRPSSLEVHYTLKKEGELPRNKSRLFLNQKQGEDLGWKTIMDTWKK